MQTAHYITSALGPKTLYIGLTFLVVFVAVDLLFLGVLAKRFYREQLGGLLRPRFALTPALLFYLIYAAGVTLLVLQPTLSAFEAARTAGAKPLWNPITVAEIYAGLFGFCAYATYNLTNLATLRDWPQRLTIMDIAWGTCATAGVAHLALHAWL